MPPVVLVAVSSIGPAAPTNRLGLPSRPMLAKAGAVDAFARPPTKAQSVAITRIVVFPIAPLVPAIGHSHGPRRGPIPAPTTGESSGNI